MKSVITLCLVLAMVSFKLSAQTMHNGWIDYSKTYYKFKVGSFGTDGDGYPIKSGAVRISQAQLVAAGLGSVPAEQLQLWHNGQEVRLFTSVSTGTLSAADYIEFWGQMADGQLDAELYNGSTLQLSNYWSLESDSAAYFFTINASGTNKRFTQVANNTSTATIQPEKNFNYTAGKYYRDMINPGYGSSVTESAILLYSSSYSAGEGLTSGYSGSYASYLFDGLYADTTAGPMSASFVFAGTALNARSVQIGMVNQTTFALDSIARIPVNYYGTSTTTIGGLSPKYAANNTVYIGFTDVTTASNDNFVIAQIQMNYARLFNFGGLSNFEFYLAASDTGRLIKVANFSSNGVAPVLYDIANGNVYTANVVGDSAVFLLQPSTQQYDLAMVRGDGSAAESITAFQTRNFTDFTQKQNQGNYLIITNPLLYGSGSSNYIAQYQAYRNSAAGGSFNAQVIDINDLEDQFAYGVKRHPLAIKDFLIYARSKFSTAPAYAFLIGKAIDYTQYRLNENSSLVYQTGLLPTFGDPGSDNLLSSPNFDPVPATPIGRLSAVSPAEVGVYLTKIQQYEAAQQTSPQTAASRSWMKNVLHLTGADDPSIGQQLDTYMANYKSIITDTLFGANVTTFSKTANAATYPQAISSFASIFNQGSSIVNYFGHSSSTNLDFGLESPANYTNTGKYPLFIVNGCLAGNIFDYDVARLSLLSTISEKFVLTPQKGSIGFVATSSYGKTDDLDIYTTQLYNGIDVKDYDKGFGIIMQDAINTGFTITGPSDYYGRIHAEQYTFQGDPALKMNTFSEPDYAIDSNSVTITPSFVSVADDSFSIKIPIYNLGEATNDSVHFALSQLQPNGSYSVVYTTEFASLKNEDSVTVTLPLVANRDNGQVVLKAYIDDNNKIAELNETNNIANIVIPVSAAEIRPIFPYNYAIVGTSTVTLAASTADPLDTTKQYIMELDTTVLFNSPVKQTFNQTSSGGVLTFKNVSLALNNTVYYWHIAIAGPNHHWNMFSFTHNNGAGAGFEQGHYYQHTQSSFNNMMLDSSRNFDFATSASNIFVKQQIYDFVGGEDADFSVALNGTFVAESACVGQSIIFNVFDGASLAPRPNPGSAYGSGGSCKGAETVNNFEFGMTSPAARNNAKTFLDSFVRKGDYVVARSVDWGDFASVWAADSTIYGSGNTLYARLKAQGILVDSYYYVRSFIFMWKNYDSTDFSPQSVYSVGGYDATTLSENLPVSDTVGYVTSPKFGPAENWNTVSWAGTNLNTNNIAKLNVIGIDKNNKDTVLYTIDKSQASQSVSAVNAATYPYIQLQMFTQDSITAIPYQLKNWSITYTPVPEGALAANIGVSLPDTIKVIHPINTQFDTLQGYIIFKNVSTSNFDSLKVLLAVSDSTGKTDTFPVPSTKPLVAGDTVKVAFLANITAFPQGKYNINLVVNPGGQQPEQFSFNNSLYSYVYVQRNQILPVTLVSFTGQAEAEAVALKWTVTNELNFSNYGVERSTDGVTYTLIGTVPAQSSNTENEKNYTFTDNNPANGYNYYRLKLVDKDGAYSYSKIVAVDFGGAQVKVYPNPFTSQLIVTTDGSGSTNVVRVLDVAGKRIMEKTFTGGSITLDVSGLAAGSYLVQVGDGTTLKTFKVQKHAQ